MNIQKSKIILPVGSPMITSYTAYTSIMCIINQYEKANAWIFNHFINLWIAKNEFGVPIRFSSWIIKNECPFIYLNSLRSDVVKGLFDDIIDFITTFISIGYYLSLSIDEYHMPMNTNYQRFHRQHELFIYGFDKEKQIFNVADFFINRKFSFQEIAFDKVAGAMVDENGSFRYDASFFDIMKYDDIDYSFDVQLLIKSIKDYIESRHTLLNYESNILVPFEADTIKKGKMVFGVSTYNILIDYLKRLKEDNTLFKDIRPFHTLWDHKVIMLSRLDYLKRNNYIKEDEDLKSRFNFIEKKCNINRSLFIRYIRTGDETMIDKLITNIHEIKDMEKDTMISLMRELEDT